MATACPNAKYVGDFIIPHQIPIPGTNKLMDIGWTRVSQELVGNGLILILASYPKPRSMGLKMIRELQPRLEPQGVLQRHRVMPSYNAVDHWDFGRAKAT